MKSLMLGGFLAIATLGLACTGPNRIFANTGGSGGGGQGGNGGADAGGGGGGHSSGLHVSVPPDPTVLRQGSDVVVDVKVDRSGPSSTPSTITVSKLPTGVTADPLEIAADAPSGHLHLHATAGAVQGIAGVVVNATAGPLHGSANLTLVVAGAPGTPDASFVNAGTLQTQIGGVGTRGRGLVIQPDGKIVVAGMTVDSFGFTQALALRLTDTGTFDMAFGSMGVASFGLSGSAAYCVAVEPSGRLVLGGFSAADVDGNCELAVMALLPTGDLDQTFGSGGTATSPPGSGCGHAAAVLPDANGVVAIGPFVNAVNVTSTTLYGFDPNGMQTATNSDAMTTQTAGRQADGKLLYGGTDSASEFFLTRLTDVMTKDASFSGGGTAFASFLNRYSTATGLALLSGGRILLGGVTTDIAGSDPEVGFVRINSNGSVDLSFANGGRALSNVPMWTKATNSFVLDSQGRILFGGFVGSGNQQPAIARFLADGTPDPAFGPAGVGYVVLDQLPTDPSNTNVGVWGIGVDAFDRVVVSGDFGPDSSSSLFVARLWF